jgi:hypothetical protein
MGLTEEQKQKIEAKRQQALQLRAAKLQSTPAPVSSTYNSAPRQASKNVSNHSCHKFSSSAPAQSTQSKSSKFTTTDVIKQVTQAYPTSSGKASLSGKCVLISRDRFVVEVGYSAPLIQIFKTLQTGQYGLFLSQNQNALKVISPCRCYYKEMVI